MSQLVRHYDTRATSYDRNAMHTELAAFLAEWMTLAGDERVLDVATGTGLVLRALTVRRPALDVAGVDLSAGMLAVAARHLGERVVRADATRLPVGDASMDVVTCVTALHLMPDPAAVFAEWRRVLRPGGRAVTATFVPPDDHVERADGIYRDHASFETVAGVEAFGWPVARSTVWSCPADRVLVCELGRP